MQGTMKLLGLRGSCHILSLIIINWSKRPQISIVKIGLEELSLAQLVAEVIIRYVGTLRLAYIHEVQFIKAIILICRDVVHFKE
jgi:hypothetical protein